ncbi:MAG: hypothetical protein CMH30_08285 [Micavibrio sp.]|nr:hypothetical protein [Micavibrio sp.]|tara:strand:+ start:1514 stop:2632 length:1119 start_codon:yes stop_codon:yes gene_type:complete
MYDGVEAEQSSDQPQRSTKPFKGEIDPKKAIVYTPRKKHFSPISVADIWTLLAQKKSRNEIRQKYPRLKARHIDIAESFMMENYRPIYSAVMGEPQTPYRVWIDECVRWSIGSAVHRAGFGKVRSVVQSDKSGTKDPYLWRFLLRKRADLIITRDARDVAHKDDKLGMNLKRLSTQHLTTLAQKSREHSLCAQWYRDAENPPKRFPFILIIDNTVKSHQTANLLEKYRNDILACVERKETIIYARLGHNGIHSIRTIENLKDSVLEPLANSVLRDIEKQDGFSFSVSRKMRRRKNQSDKIAIARYSEEREKLKQAVIAFAKAQNMIIDHTLARFVIALHRAQSNTSPKQKPQSLQPASHQDHLVPLHRASLG